MIFIVTFALNKKVYKSTIDMWTNDTLFIKMTN